MSATQVYGPFHGSFNKVCFYGEFEWKIKVRLGIHISFSADWANLILPPALHALREFLTLYHSVTAPASLAAAPHGAVTASPISRSIPSYALAEQKFPRRSQLKRTDNWGTDLLTVQISSLRKQPIFELPIWRLCICFTSNYHLKLGLHL